MINKTQFKDLLILSIRILLSLIFISYGVGKLIGGQFGNLTEQELSTPIKDLSLFKIAWYLFDHQPFKMFIGISQIIAALLLLYKRTMIIGALMLIPIVANILIIDLTIMPYGFKIAFAFRLTLYLFYIALLLYYYRKDLFPVIGKMSSVQPSRDKLNRKMPYLLLLLMIPALEIIPSVLKMSYFAITHPQVFWDSVNSLF